MPRDYDPNLLLGRRESETLEIKAAETLRTMDGRRALARGVVALLNRQSSEPAQLWVGLVEHASVATSLDPLGLQDRAHLDRLRDLLLDAIEPVPHLSVGTPLPDPASLALIPVGPMERWFLCIEIRGVADASRPFCLRFGNTREFVRRIDARIHALSYDEIVNSGARRASTQGELDEARAHHNRWVKRFGSIAGFAFTLRRVPPIEAAMPSPPEEWENLLCNPPSEIARPLGWSWSHQSGASVKRRSEFLASGVRMIEKGRVGRYLELRGNGDLEFFTGAQDLTWQPHRIDPTLLNLTQIRGQLTLLCIAEILVSLFRLSAKLLPGKTTNRPKTLYATASLHGFSDWIIPIWRPERIFPLLARSQVVKLSASPWQPDSLRLLTTDLASEGGPDRLARATLLRLLELDPEVSDLTSTSLPYFESGSRFTVHD